MSEFFNSSFLNVDIFWFLSSFVTIKGIFLTFEDVMLVKKYPVLFETF